ncbi:MAG TPA: enoyl-CoA hydratase/isomerase family protein [Castellaniella sp.]|uniref:enoyl-CoA hydratase/isomerase family protein n=1 Tax=Castellaniella sp. TaxID=1955812 RepID=UPI002F191353
MHYVHIDRRESVAIVTLDRPERRNALGSELLSGLIAAFAQLSTEAAVGAIVLDGAGKGFCAGADLKEFSGDDRDAVSRLNLVMGAFVRSIPLMSKPVIAAVDGFALGGGLMLAISCDLVVTSPQARWGLPEVSLGWLPGFGLSTLVDRVGLVKARRIAFGAEPFNGTEAVAIGLADILSGEQSALDTALSHAQKLAALPARAVGSVKHYFSLMTRNAETMDVFANRVYAQDAESPEALDTMRARREK